MKTAPTRHRINIRLPLALYTRAITTAKHQNIPLNTLITNALDAYLRDTNTRSTP